MDEKLNPPDTGKLWTETDTSASQFTESRATGKKSDWYWGTAVALVLVLGLFILFNTRTR